MGKRLRNSGIDIIGKVPWGAHFCQFYRTKKDLMDILVPYFKAGLENNEFCIWVTSQPLEVEEAKECLKKAVPGFEIYLERGQIEIVPETHCCINEGILDSEIAGWGEKLNRALESGYEGLRITGNTGWLDKEGLSGFVTYENKIGSFIEKHQVIALCPYNLEICSAAEILEIAFNHQFSLIKKAGNWELIENSGRKEVENAVSKAVDDWKQAFNSLPDLVAIIDNEYRIVHANRAMAAKLGTTPEECAGSTCYNVMHGTNEPHSSCPHRHAIENGHEYITEVHEDILGEDFELSISPVYDSDGKVAGCVHVARDITERKKVEEALQESEEKYRTIVETANEGICVVDSEARITYVNKKIAEMLGYEREEFAGRFAWDFADEENKDILKKNIIKRPLSTSESYEMKLKCKDGSPLWAFISAKAFFNKEKRFTGSISMLTDITRRKEAEEALIRSENEFRTLAENSPDLISRFDRQNRHIYVNPATAEIYGYSYKEIIGKTHAELGLDPEKAKFWNEYGQKVFNTGNPETIEFSYVIPQGKKHYFNTRIVPEFVNGKVVSVLAISRDITDIKETEFKLKEILDNLEELVEERTAELENAYKSLKESERKLSEAQRMAHIGNWEWDLATKKTYLSDEMYHIFGLDPQKSNVPYDEILNYIHPDDRDYVKNAVKKALKEGSGSIGGRIISANGEERAFHAQTEIVYDVKNNPVRMRGTFQDITDLKKAEEKILTLANAVESSNDAIVTESLDGIITSWNKAAEQIYGYSAEEIVGKKVSILEPDNIKGEIKYFSEMIKKGKKVHHYETLRLKKDGSIINISVTLSPILNSYGELVAISAIVRDVTERKREEKALRESEARLRRFYESDMFGVIYYNLDGSITDANDKFLEIVGYTREDLQAGQVNWDRITPPEYRFLDEQSIKELKTTGGLTEPREKEYIRKDGSRVPVMIGAATFDRDRCEGIAFAIDITERKKAQKALAEIEKIRIKEIHHRIKNNLQVIYSLLDLQAEKFRDKDVLEAFKESQNRVISMSLIHEELYKGGGADTLNFSAYLQKLAERLFKTYSLSRKNVHLSMDLEESAFFDMDTAVPLGIIVNELVSNSLKHAFPDLEGEIRIQLRKEKEQNEANKSLFSLIVSDNGIGIPKDVELRNFESLGMNLVNTLVDQLNGKIELIREHGTEFKITFSVAKRLQISRVE
jgi:PAS domain S-box-containing protein